MHTLLLSHCTNPAKLPWRTHLEERGLTDFFPYWLEEEKETVKFPLYTFGGKLSGYQRYYWLGTKDSHSNKDPFGRYYTWIKEDYRHTTCWGLDLLPRDNSPIFIVEGIWDAISIWRGGHSAIAILSCPHSNSFRWTLRHQFNYRHLISVCDNDENNTGLDLAKMGDRSIIVPAEYHDANNYFIKNRKGFEEWIGKQ